MRALLCKRKQNNDKDRMQTAGTHSTWWLAAKISSKVKADREHKLSEKKDPRVARQKEQATKGFKKRGTLVNRLSRRVAHKYLSTRKETNSTRLK